MSEFTIQATCPKCGEELALKADIPTASSVPDVRSKITPVGSIQVYKITSEMMKAFIIAKAKKYCPSVKMDIVPRYTERKARKNEPHRAYASLRIAFSEEIVEKKEDLGFYGKLVESNFSPRIQPSIYQNLIRMYGYTPKEINSWLDSYKNMEELEEGLGITEAYLDDLKRYATPRMIESNDNQKWIIFSADAANVITDMLTDINSNEPIGRIQIQDVYQISKDIIEFIVYVHPTAMKLKENPHVRQILLGEEKPKK